MIVLQLEEVVKAYEKHLAVDKVSFDVPKSSIFGLLGPNGAGKTTLIRIITTIIRADSGRVFFNGEALNNNHPSQIGYMPEERGLYKKMKVGDHLIYLARLKGLSKSEAKEKIHHWLDKFDISDWWAKKVNELSKGMQQKIQFISTVVHEPELLILDEPFSGLDPINTNLIKSEIRQLQENGTSIIFSTHRMEQVEEICEHIVLINKGQNVLEGKVNDIKNTYKQNIFQLEYEGRISEDILKNLSVVEKAPGKIRIQLEEGQDSNASLNQFLQQGIKIISFNEIFPSLNEIFIRQVEGV